MTRPTDEPADRADQSPDDPPPRSQPGKATSSSGRLDKIPDVEIIERDVTCATCKDVFRATGTKMGKTVVIPRVCDTCLRAEDERIVGSITVFKTLQGIGFNVKRHGRAKLDDIEFETRNVLFEFAETVRALREWQEMGSLYLMGPTGTGKTHAMVATARYLIESGYLPGRIVFVRARALVSEVWDTYGSGGVDAVVDRYRSAGILFVDDAGTEKVHADAFRIVEDILDAREGHPTVWSSNNPPDELVAQWADSGVRTDRFRSRLSGFRFIEFTGSDRRFSK